MQSSLPFLVPSVAALALITLGCSGTLVEPSYSGAPSSSSGYSASLGSQVSSSGSSGITVSARPISSELTVRPDAVQLTFALGEHGADPQKLLADLKTRADGAFEQIKSAAGGAATVKMCGASTSAASSGKALSEEAPSYGVRVDGSIEIKLAPEQDYWARSQLMAALARVTRELATSLKSSDPKIDVAFSELTPVVKDTSQHRAKLLSRWALRAREFAQIAQVDRAPLAVTDCAPPGEVEQRVVSLEEIALVLQVNCKLTTIEPGKAGSPGM